MISPTALGLSLVIGKLQIPDSLFFFGNKTELVTWRKREGVD